MCLDENNNIVKRASLKIDYIDKLTLIFGLEFCAFEGQLTVKCQQIIEVCQEINNIVVY